MVGALGRRGGIDGSVRQEGGVDSASSEEGGMDEGEEEKKSRRHCAISGLNGWPYDCAYDRR